MKPRCESEHNGAYDPDQGPLQEGPEIGVMNNFEEVQEAHKHCLEVWQLNFRETEQDSLDDRIEHHYD